MKIIKVVDWNKTFKNKKGNTQPTSYYVIRMDNGKQIFIKPIYEDGYVQLDLISELKVIEAK